MKKKYLLVAVALLLSVLSLLMTGCHKSKTSADPFYIFSDVFSATLSVEISGNQSACSFEKQGDGAKITLTAPSVLSGFTFNVNNEKITLKTGETEIEADGKISFLPRLLSYVFSAKKENITEIKTEKADGYTVTLIKTETVSYRFGTDGTPISAEGIFDGKPFKVTFGSFTSDTGVFSENTVGAAE